MPTQANFNELKNTAYTTHVFERIDGVKCIIYTSKSNGNQIIFPYAGSIYGNASHSGTFYYWSSTISSESGKAIVAYAYNEAPTYSPTPNLRERGCHIRAIKVP